MFVAANVPFLNQCDDVNVCTYAATKELKSKALTVNSQNIRYVIAIQVKKSFKNNIFFVKYNCFFGDLWVHFEPLLGWEYAHICPRLKNWN